MTKKLDGQETPESRLIRAIQKIICHFSTLPEVYGKKLNSRIEVRNGELTITEGYQDAAGALARLGLYQKEIENNSPADLQTVEKFIDYAIETTRLLGPPILEVRQEEWDHKLTRTPDGELTAEYLELEDPDIQREIAAVNLCVAKIKSSVAVNSKARTMREKIIWLSSVTDLAELFLTLDERGYIQAENKTRLFQAVSTTFDRKEEDGPIAIETLRRSPDQTANRKTKQAFSEWLDKLPPRKDS